MLGSLPCSCQRKAVPGRREARSFAPCAASDHHGCTATPALVAQAVLCMGRQVLSSLRVRDDLGKGGFSHCP